MLFFVLEFEWQEIRTYVSSRIKVGQTEVQFQSRLRIIKGMQAGLLSKCLPETKRKIGQGKFALGL
jgi:hypothetical protein